MISLYLAWQDSASRSWFPIGVLRCSHSEYHFAYLQGVHAARQHGFAPLPSFSRLDRKYRSRELFPLFANRLLNRSRPDYHLYLGWLNFPKEEQPEPLELLARSGGARVTDQLEVFPAPGELGNGHYSVRFFVHGLRHMPRASADRVEQLVPGERLFLLHDFQNPFDKYALMVRSPEKSDGDVFPLGYCPRYLFADSFDRMQRDSEWPRIVVERVNPAPAPIRFRLLCKAEFVLPGEQRPFDGPAFHEYDALRDSTPVA